ncbi:hypothetical protein CRUP_001738, partial [Coryphaenoides rupestris]
MQVEGETEVPPSSSAFSRFPTHNYSNVLKYLTFCMVLCPGAFSDLELTLFLALSSRLGLESGLVLEPHLDLRRLQRRVLLNVQDWEHTLSYLLPYLSRMKPSSLVLHVRASRSAGSLAAGESEEDVDALDQQTYHLCYSLLTLVNQASNYHFIQPHQKEELLQLSSALERHIKRRVCDAKCLYRSQSRLHVRASRSAGSLAAGRAEEDVDALDQQTYHLCYSLLTLVNQASNYHFIQPHQKEELLQLSSALERHIKRRVCDAKCLYRSQ